MASAPASSWTVASLLRISAEYLAEKGSSSPRLDAELLLAEALQLERIQLIIQAERPLTEEEVTRYRELVARRARREPIAYILGRAAFRYLELEVAPGVLIPRPETEELVQAALEELRVRPPLAPVAGTGGWAAPVVADLGTGSGAIALSLAAEGGVRVLATESSGEALGIARRNRERLGLTGAVELVSADLLGEFASGTLRLLVSNPPYIPTAEYEGLEPDVRDYEPRAALEAGADGLEVYRRLAPAAVAALGPGGVLLVEVGHDQAERVGEVLRAAGLAQVTSQKDLSGRERIVRALRPGAAVRDPRELGPWEAAAVASALRQGAVVGVPTDTVYGLAAAWDSSPGIERLFAAKGRPPESPVAALFASVTQIEALLPDLSGPARLVLRRLLPGPYTFVVATRTLRPERVGTPDSLGVRVPDNPVLMELLRRTGVPLAATSANRSGLPAPATLSEAEPDLLTRCSLAFENLRDAPRTAGVASTVVDLRPLDEGGMAQVLREGAVPAEPALEAVADALRAGQQEPDAAAGRDAPESDLSQAD